jgi:hypothetical protein
MIAGLALLMGLVVLITVEPGPGALAYNLIGLALVLLSACLQPKNRK